MRGLTKKYTPEHQQYARENPKKGEKSPSGRKKREGKEYGG